MNGDPTVTKRESGERRAGGAARPVERYTHAAGCRDPRASRQPAACAVSLDSVRYAAAA
ncbi:hypothetical protein [Embleya sp. AB8]|uniref:hypothetical protein n=1 Tax=Embleya sp. AB8 TaxID=3156304 RepID=UPI003C78B09D